MDHINGWPSLCYFYGIYILKLENDIVAPFKQTFYRRYVGDMFNRREGNTNNIVERLNNYYSKNKNNLPLKSISWKKKLINDDDIYSNMVNGKSTKLLIAW